LDGGSMSQPTPPQSGTGGDEMGQPLKLLGSPLVLAQTLATERASPAVAMCSGQPTPALRTSLPGMACDRASDGHDESGYLYGFGLSGGSARLRGAQASHVSNRVTTAMRTIRYVATEALRDPSLWRKTMLRDAARTRSHAFAIAQWTVLRSRIATRPATARRKYMIDAKGATMSNEVP